MKHLEQKSDFRRKKPSRERIPCIVIFCEGRETEYNYFNSLGRHLRLNTFKVIPGNDNSFMKLAKQSIEHKNRNPDDIVFCVFDRDNKTDNDIANFHKILIAKNSDIQVNAIQSTPCFELWLLLHIRYTTRNYRDSSTYSCCDAITREIDKFMQDEFNLTYSKNSTNIFENFRGRLGAALIHADKLAAYNKVCDSQDPSTNVQILVQELFAQRHRQCRAHDLQSRNHACLCHQNSTPGPQTCFPCLTPLPSR